MEKLTKDELDIIIQALYNSNVRVVDAPVVLKLIEKVLKIKEEVEITYGAKTKRFYKQMDK